MKPLVSVIIPMYNGANTIRRAIESVLDQTYKNIEIIVVDDSSTDASAQIVGEYISDRVKLIVLPQNSGANAARNIGIREANGDYIAFQDSDDEWFPTKLEAQMDYVLENNLQAVFCPYYLVDEYSVRQVPSKQIIAYMQDRSVREVLHERNVIGTPTLLVHRKVIEHVGMFDEKLPRFQDYDLAIRISQKYDIGFVSQVLVNAYNIDVGISQNNSAYIEAVQMLYKKYPKFFYAECFLQIGFDGGAFEDNDGVNMSELEGLCRLFALDDKEREICFKNTVIEMLAQKYSQSKIRNILYSDMSIRHLKNSSFAIYGAGSVGKAVCDYLAKRNLKPQCFIVSQSGEEKQVKNIPVRQLDEIEDRNIEIIVAVSPPYQKEIVENLEKAGFRNFFIPDSDKLLKGLQL